MVHWIGDRSEMGSQLVLGYANSAADAVNWLRTTLRGEMRVLVVGGGGAGGYGLIDGANPDPGVGDGGGGGDDFETKGKPVKKILICILCSIIPAMACGAVPIFVNQLITYIKTVF